VVAAGDKRYTIADVPGLIEGASEGKGLGLDFLRHVERCSALCHVIDCATLEPGRDPMTDFKVIQEELKKYEVPEGQLPLLERPQNRSRDFLCLTKKKIPGSRFRPKSSRERLSTALLAQSRSAGLHKLTLEIQKPSDTLPSA